ncbi:16S rRNA (uracil(1498)-N(3))-methyltransferase [Nocardioides mesophilus]|uniref:Ribosomal RNA small subunit methyltransferase E n=1 Tax=Nocardioides mesophilus TaxID=433659 RepID=A0A7G9RCM2_9ACTN|nr:16S rRNA (uracil(1498)-N(3))-methyltransferase [Nocardioides mesophilus]QNN53347.1 16S rRNA (uracil(1498)-N(3))-methyltransferase [Nocardioides mesophilus]
MSLPFFHHQGVAGLVESDRVELDGDEGRHAVVVKRLRVGEQLALTDGAGTTVVATVTSTAKAALTATVDSSTWTEPELPRVVVVQAIPKGDRGELAVEMLTEVGVDLIVPWAAARSVAVWRGDRVVKSLAKWRSTAREAAKQARRPWFPDVSEMVGTEEVVELLRHASVPVVLHEAASGPLADLPVPGRGEIVIVVGPEGGITEDELAAFAAVGAEAVRLGSSVLRTSTAGVAATAALLARTRWR